MTKSQLFIQQYKKKLQDGAGFFNPDTAYQPAENYDKAKLRVLIIFPSPSSVKSVSTTKEAINDYILEQCPEVFVDFAFMPESGDGKLYDDANIPYCLGTITHLDASHFDVVGFSISVLSDAIAAPCILNTFSRCDKPIPLTWSERKDLPLGSCPIFEAGGITAACGDIMYGNLGDGRQAFMDYTYLGAFEDKNPLIFKRLIEAKETGKVTRKQEDHDVVGYAQEIIPDFQEVVEVKTNQDFIEACFDLTMVYQPQAYDVKFDDAPSVISNKKINPKARDFVRPYYPHEMSNMLGIGRTLINATGANAGVSQVQVSEGAHMRGNRIRTADGLVRVETLCPLHKGEAQITGTVDTSLGEGCLYHAFNQGVKPVRVFTLKSGIKIGLTDEHPVEQWMIGWPSTGFVRADRLKVGDFFITKKSDVFGNYPMTTDEAEFLGRMLGDGTYNLYKDPRAGHNAMIHRMYLACAWSEADYCRDLLERACIDYTVDTNQGRHCRFWIKSVDKKGRKVRDFYGFNKQYTKVEGKPSIKYIPEPAYKLNEECMKAFLKGYHDADGCTSTKAGLSKVTFDCCHESIIDDIQQFLLMVGIPSRKHYNEKSRIADEEYGFYDTVNEHWSLVISSEYFDKFNDLGVLKQASGRNELSKEHLPFDVETIRDIIYDCNLSTEDRSNAFHAVSRGSFTKSKADSCGIEYPKNFIFDEIVNIEFTESETYDLSVLNVERLIANGCSVHNCSAGGQCSFCSEGCYTGGWVEKPRDVINKHVRESKKYSAGYKFKPFSFNCNYVTDYKGWLKELLGMFPKVTFLNMRMEELGRDTDAIKMMKLVGSNRMSAPIEGLSPRIQNNLLNKCLSEESLYNFMDDMVHMRLTDIKVGGIFTGYEEDEDFQWICDFVDGFKKKAKDEMGNFPFRLKVTPLVHYQLTACEYLERKSARKSYEGEHWLTDEWYDKFREHNVFFKVNGFRYSTFLEQCIIDFGRYATPIVYNLIVKQNLPVYSLRSIAKDNIIDAFKSSINPDKFFEARDPDHYISLSHRIHIDLMGSYIPRARRLVRCYKNGNIFDNEMDIRCLKTFDGAKTKCYARCAVKEPLKIYNDVELVDGELVGENPHLLLGCERCQTNELRLARLQRSTPQTATSEDIIALPRIPKVEKIRFVISRNPEYDLLNPNNTAHTFIAKFLQESDNLLDSFHSVEGHNLFWQSDPEMVYYTAGYQIVDTWWKKSVISEVKELIPTINSKMKSLRIVKASTLVEGDKLDCNDINIFKFETSIPSAVFDASFFSYKGDVRIDMGMGQSEIKQDKDLIPPVYISKDKIYGFFACPAKYNPLNYLAGFFAGRTYTVNKIAALTNLTCMMTVRENKAICSACGKEKAVYNLLTDKPYALGKSCLLKALLKNL